MRSVTVSQTIEASPKSVRATIQDLEPFMEAAGFDEVTVDGQTIRVANRVGLAEIELVLDLIREADATLAYEQREGIFESMETVYSVTPAPRGSEVTARTTFALDIALVGDVLDATVIKRQRRRELDAQLDWLAATLDTDQSRAPA